MLIAFDGLSRPILLKNCEALFALLKTVLPTWSFGVVEASDCEPIVSVTRVGEGYRVEAPWLEDDVVQPTAVSAVSNLVVDLVRAFVDEHPSLLCLHCAAVEIAGRLLVFPSTARAGKSTLVAALASRGFRVGADDMLPIAAPDEDGIALGILPRLRRPLPPKASEQFRRFVTAHTGPRDLEYQYLALDPAKLVPHGAGTSIGAFVLLERKAFGPAELTPLAQSLGLQQLIVQNFAESGLSVASVDRLHALVARSPAFTLTYADADQAAAILGEHFADWTKLAPRHPPAASQTQAVANEVAMPLPLRRSRADGPLLVQSPDVSLRAIDGDLFLIPASENGVFHLNPTAAGLWRLLEQPISMRSAVDVLRAAFPEADPRRIKRDVRVVFDTFRSGGLIRAASAAPATPDGSG